MLALAAVDQLLFEEGIDGGPVAWLHDEIVMEIACEHADRAAALLAQAMTKAFAETFPGAPLEGLVEPHIGNSWGEAKSEPTQRAQSRSAPKPPN
jgi:DNA polymerase I-like protein with 3'-5' exonuclease and polymerase domains